MGSIRRTILLTVVIASLCSAADPVRTDREVLLLQCDSVISMIGAEITSLPSISVVFGSDTVTTFFRPNMLQRLTATTVPVQLQSDPTGTTLELHVQESSVFYGEVFTESFFGTRKCERRVKVAVMASLISPDKRKVLTSRTVSSTSVDTVEFATVAQLHSSSIPMTRFTAPALTFFDSFLEPAIVTVASGIVIYLFFTIRS